MNMVVELAPCILPWCHGLELSSIEISGTQNLNDQITKHAVKSYLLILHDTNAWVPLYGGN